MNCVVGHPRSGTALVAQILKVSAAYTPPPPEGFVSPMLWGVEEQVRERFGADVMRETLRRSSLGAIEPGSTAMPCGTR